MSAVYEAKATDLNNSLAPLLSQVRMAMLSGVDQEFLLDEEVASLEVTAAQFVIIANVLKGHANSACALCKYMDYDRGAMSRMIDIAVTLLPQPDSPTSPYASPRCTMSETPRSTCRSRPRTR